MTRNHLYPFAAFQTELRVQEPVPPPKTPDHPTTILAFSFTPGMEGPIISVSSARSHHEIVCGAFFLDMMGDEETRPMSLTSGEYEIGIDLSEGEATVTVLKTPAPMDPVTQTRLEQAIWQSWNSTRIALS